MKYNFKYPRFNDIFLRNNFPKIKDGAYVINLDNKNSKGTHWVSLFIDINLPVYFDYFGIEANQLLTIYLEYKILNLLCLDIIVSLF